MVHGDDGIKAHKYHEEVNKNIYQQFNLGVSSLFEDYYYLI